MFSADFVADRTAGLGDFIVPIIGGVYDGIRQGAYDRSGDFEAVMGRPHQKLGRIFQPLQIECDGNAGPQRQDDGPSASFEVQQSSSLHHPVATEPSRQADDPWFDLGRSGSRLECPAFNEGIPGAVDDSHHDGQAVGEAISTRC